MVRANGSGLSDRLYIAATLAVRMGVSLLVLPVLARGLGTTQFGLFSTVIGYATLISLVTDFGYSVKTLRDIAAAPDRAGEILTETLAAKGVLTLMSMAIGTALIALLPLSWNEKASAILIAAGVLGASYGDLGLVAFRSFGRYARETWITTLTLIPYLVLLTPLAFIHAGVIWVALVFFATRIGYMVMALAAIKKLVPTLKIQLTVPMKALRGSSAWAMDSGLGYLVGQIDGLVVAHVLGLSAAGIYSSHARFVQAALMVGQALANIHIPRVASKEGQGRRIWPIILEFTGLGVAGGLFFLFGGPLITRYLLGPQYVPGDILWPGLAAYLFVRFLATAFGSMLSAKAAPALRVGAQLTGLAVIGAGFAVFLARYGIGVAPWVMTAGSTTTVAIYALGFWRIIGREKKAATAAA